MKNKRHRQLIALLTAGCIGLLGGCGTYTDSDTSSSSEDVTADDTASDTEVSSDEIVDTGAAEQSDDSFTIAIDTWETLNPIQSASNTDFDIFYLLNAGLFRYYYGELSYELCESYEISEDGCTYTFTLRDAQWSDGEPITAEDFVTTVEAMLDPEGGASMGYVLYGIRGATSYAYGEVTDFSEVGVYAEDDQTLVIELEAEDDFFIERITTYTLYPTRADFLEEVGDSYGSSADTLLYSGPYVVEDLQLNSSLTLVKNEYYWDSDNSFPTKVINMLIIDDAGTRISMFENGELDAMEQIPSQYMETYEDVAVVRDTNALDYLWINTNTPTSEEAQELLSNQNFRLALSYALDREAIYAAIDPSAEAYSRVVSSEVTMDDGESYTETYEVEYVGVSGDSEKALEYLNTALEELGYSDVSELPAITYMSVSSDVYRALGETIVDQWKQILGLTNIQYESYDMGTAFSYFYSNQYDIFFLGLDFGIAPYDGMAYLATGGDYNFGIWTDETFDDLLSQTKAAYGSDEFYDLLAETEEEFLTYCGLIPLARAQTWSMVQDYVEGFHMADAGYGFEFNHLIVNQ